MSCTFPHSPGRLRLLQGALTSPSQAFNYPVKSFTLYQQHWRADNFPLLLPTSIAALLFNLLFSSGNFQGTFWLRRVFPAPYQVNRWGAGPRNGWLVGAGLRGVWKCPSWLQGPGSLLKTISSFPKSLIGFLKTPSTSWNEPESQCKQMIPLHMNGLLYHL